MQSFPDIGSFAAKSRIFPRSNRSPRLPDNRHSPVCQKKKERRNQGRSRDPYHGARQNSTRPDAPLRERGAK